jgi:ABC-type transport system involved in multi-copper enzyme maturation permease subunit
MSIFFSTLRKLVRRPATWVTFGLLAGLLVLILLAVAATGGGAQGGFDPLSLITFPAAYNLILNFTVGLGGLFALIYGAAIAGSEWSWGTLKAVVARGESRALYGAATFAGIAVVAVAALLVSFAIGVGAAAIGATLAAVPLDGLGNSAAVARLPESFARGAVGIVTLGALGYGIATLARSQLAGIGVGIGVYFAGTFAAVFLPNLVQYLPFQLSTTALGAATSGGGGFGGGAAPATNISPDLALLLLGMWLVGSLVVATGFTERAEITG